MTWFANLEVRTKVVGAFALVLMVTCGLGLFSLQRLSVVNDGARNVTENWLVATRALGSFSTAAMRYRQVQGSIGVAPTAELVVRESTRLEKDVLPQVQAALAEFEPTITAGPERELFDGVMPLWNSYLAANEKYLEVARADHQAAAQMYIGDMNESYSRFQDALNRLIDFQMKGVRAETADIEATSTAGHAGKGFGVVASEVRALANRTTGAAREIAVLIATSREQVASGVECVQFTGQALHRIVEKVGEIDGLVAHIASSAGEQADSLDRVNSAMNRIDSATRENAAMVQQTTQITRGMHDDAGMLDELTGRFIVDTGDESQGWHERAEAPLPLQRLAS